MFTNLAVLITVNPQKIKENNNIQRIDVGNHRFTNSNDIANGLTNYFGTIGESLANKIPTNKDSFKRFLQNKNRNKTVSLCSQLTLEK